MRLYRFTGLFFSLVFLGSTAVRAENSGFLPDYTGLEFAAGEHGEKFATVPGVREKSRDLTKMMVDQPEIFIADDSAYKGLKPDDAYALAESLRGAVVANILPENRVEEAGPDVLYLRIAITDLRLKKKKRRLVSFTPVGLVAHTAKDLVVSDVTKKIELVGVTVEMETLNASTGEHLGSLVMKLEGDGGAGSDEATWQNLMVKFDALGQQLVCQLRNIKLPKAEREDCKVLESYREA